MSDWEQATDPVPARREIVRTPEQLARIRARLKRFKSSYLVASNVKDAANSPWVEPDFEDMGA